MKTFLALTCGASASAVISALTCSSSCSSYDCPSSEVISAGSSVTYSVARGHSYCTDLYGQESHNYIAELRFTSLDSSTYTISFNNAADAPNSGSICSYRTTKPIGKSADYAGDVTYTVKCNNWVDNCPFRKGVTWACFVPCCYSNSGSYPISCSDGTTRTSVMSNGYIGYFVDGTSRFQAVNLCSASSTPSPTTATPTSSPKTPSPSSSSTSTFYSGMDQTFKRVSSSGLTTADMTTCAMRCARAYRVTATSSVVTFTPAVAIGDCVCDTLTAPLKSSTTVVIDNSDFEATYDKSTSVNIYVTVPSGGLSMMYAPGTPAQSFQAKKYKRVSTTCNVPESCDYQCSAAYSLALVGSDMIQATSTAATTCSCALLTAVVLDDGTAVGASGSNSYKWTTSGDAVNVDATISGTVCSGSYIPGTVSSASAASLAMGSWALLALTLLLTLA